MNLQEHLSIIAFADLSSSPEVMAKVNADHSSTVQIQHEVGEVAISYSKDILAHRQSGQGPNAVRAKYEECLRTG